MSDAKKFRVVDNLVPHKTFLSKIAAASSLSRIHNLLAGSSPTELKALLLLIHNCVTGIIPVPAALISSLVRSKRMTTLRQTFELPTNFAQLQKEKRQGQLQALLRIKSLLPAFCRIVTDDHGSDST